MDSIVEISRLVGFEFPEEIIKTLQIKGAVCDKDVEKILNSPVLPPLSYTDDCMRFITLLRYWRGKEIAKECAKAYRKIKGRRKEEEFWWSIQELLYRAKADSRVIKRYLRRLKRDRKRIERVKRKIAEMISVWILPPYVEMLSGILPPKRALKVVRYALDVLLEKSGYFSRFGISTFDVVYGLFEWIYRLSLSEESPKALEEKLLRFVDFYIGVMEISLVSGKNPIYPPFDLALREDTD